MAKLIKAVFGAGQMSRTCPQWQYDYNTILQFVGLDLPATFEVDLANSKTGQSETVLGDADGCCTIPAQYFIPGTSIFAWVYIVDSNSGYTRCQVEIPIHPRAQHTGDPPTPEQQSALDQAIALLNAATENIPNEINAALEAAKESGEFDGKDGKDGEDGSGVWYTTARISGDENPFISRRDLIGREGATVQVHDLLIAPAPGEEGEPTTLYEIVSADTACTLKRLCKIKGANGTDGASAYEIAVEHGYDGTEAEWLNSLHGADAVVDPTLSVAGEAADAKATGDELHRHYLELTALSPEIRADTYAWNLRKNYNSSGSYVTADGFGITSTYIPVQPGARVQNTAPERDGNGKYTGMHINEFSGTTWLRRTILASGKYMSIGADTTSIRIAYGYASNQGVTITQELIDATFSVRIIQQPASGSGITVDDALSGSSTNPVQNKVVKAALDGKGTYSKPASGIPKTDLASAVQTSLGKADTALQEHQSLTAYRTAQAQDTIDRQQNAAIEAKYTKPSGGIPATDLAAGVIPTVPSNVSAFENDAGYLTQHQDISGKLDKAQGAANAGKFLVVGSDGNITTVSVPSAQGVSF